MGPAIFTGANYRTTKYLSAIPLDQLASGNILAECLRMAYYRGHKSMLDTYLDILNESYFEASEAFRGLRDENVWKRPAETLLSIGEIAGHMAYWEAVKFAGNPDSKEVDVAECKVKSPLVDRRFRYYPTTLQEPPTPELLSMTAEQVGSDLQRVHTEAMVHFRQLNPDLDSQPSGWMTGNTYRAYLRYAIIHVSYHVGEIYTIRHLLGETTPDN